MVITASICILKAYTQEILHQVVKSKPTLKNTTKSVRFV